MHCICEGLCIIKSINGNSKKTSASKAVGKNELFEEVFYYNPNFTTH
jgi:hypothetical protein